MPVLSPRSPPDKGYIYHDMRYTLNHPTLFEKTTRRWAWESLLIDDAGLMGLIFLINDEESHSRQMMQNAHRTGKPYLAAVLLIMPECFRCDEIITSAVYFAPPANSCCMSLLKSTCIPYFVES